MSHLIPISTDQVYPVVTIMETIEALLDKAHGKPTIRNQVVSEEIIEGKRHINVTMPGNPYYDAIRLRPAANLVVSALANGDLHGIIKVEGEGQFYRLPRQYWVGLDYLGDLDAFTAVPPNIRGTLVDPKITGSVIVLAEKAVTAWLAGVAPERLVSTQSAASFLICGGATEARLDTLGNSDGDIPSSQIAACEAAPFWRPIQVAAWILKRDIWLVARLEALVTQPTSYSVGEVWLGAFLDLVEQTNDVKDDIVNRAAAEIVARAGSGTLKSSAMRNGSGQRHLLATHEWAGATIHFADYRESIVPTGQKWGTGDRHWTALRFERQQVVSLWPPEPQERPPSLQEGPPSLQSPPRPITKKEGDKLATAMRAQGIGKEEAVSALMDELGNPRHWWRERYGETKMGRLRRVSPVRS